MRAASPYGACIGFRWQTYQMRRNCDGQNTALTWKLGARYVRLAGREYMEAGLWVGLLGDFPLRSADWNCTELMWEVGWWNFSLPKKEEGRAWDGMAYGDV